MYDALAEGDRTWIFPNQRGDVRDYWTLDRLHAF
jgi:hypothetical protein